MVSVLCAEQYGCLHTHLSLCLCLVSVKLDPRDSWYCMRSETGADELKISQAATASIWEMLCYQSLSIHRDPLEEAVFFSAWDLSIFTVLYPGEVPFISHPSSVL